MHVRNPRPRGPDGLDVSRAMAEEGEGVAAAIPTARAEDGGAEAAGRLAAGPSQADASLAEAFAAG